MKTRKINFWALLLLGSFLVGNASGYWMRDVREIVLKTAGKIAPDSGGSHAELAKQVNPPGGHRIQATYGDAGPRLLDAGAIDYDAFVELYQRAGAPLTASQLEILTGTSSEPVVFNQENAYFLLNFFWAFGLTNQNRILTEGPMVTQSRGQVEGFASTGGWTIARKPIGELYSSTPVVTLTSAQQGLLERVAQNVYRPCCNNPTHFPDCNHGMAMLGLLELMASQGASENQMYEAAKYATAYWYPSQSMAVAVYIKNTKNVDFKDADPRLVVGKDLSSGSGFQAMYEWLSVNNLLPQAPGGGSGCGV